MKRRTFVELASLGLANSLVPRAFAKLPTTANTQPQPQKSAADFGSGHFGHWETDAHELPAYRYTCNQVTDPLAVLPVDKEWVSPTDHIHQVGNDRVVAIPSNYGYVQVRQDEGSPKFLNDYSPELPRGFTVEGLVAKYSADPASQWSKSSALWKQKAPMFRAPAHPWIEREALWNSYYLRSGFTYDSFFREHILSQGAGYQYQAGIQCAARDPLQHVLPLIFTDPDIVRQVLRYTLKEIPPDGSSPYGIVGHGVPMHCVYQPSDLQLWVLWVTAEYVLATKDRDFLNERIPAYPSQDLHPDDPTVLDLLLRSFTYITTNIGVGKHGLLKIFNGDWNDSIVYTHLTPEQMSKTMEVGESVLNAAMAPYVFEYYASMLDFAKQKHPADEARLQAKTQRVAVQAQWYDRWYRRAWLSEDQGWVGEKQMWLEPQPWALISNCVPNNKIATLVTAVDELARKPSPIGALLQSQADPTMKDEPGAGTNGGVFAAISGTLIWALATVNGDMAWDEW